METKGEPHVDKPIKLAGWRYEWDYRHDKYVTTDYMTTDPMCSYAVTRINWLGSSGTGYKVWNTETGFTEGIFPTWGEARSKAIELAMRANVSVTPSNSPGPDEAHEDAPAEAVPRAQPPTKT